MSGGKLVAFDSIPPLRESVIERLEEALKEAHAGEVSSVAIVIVCRDGYTKASWSECPTISTLIGGVERLKYSLLKRASGDE